MIEPECFLRPKLFDGAGEKAFAVIERLAMHIAIVIPLAVNIMVVKVFGSFCFSKSPLGMVDV